MIAAAAIVAVFGLLLNEDLAISGSYQLLTNAHLDTSIQHELDGRKG